jgi:hypothetical protein
MQANMRTLADALPGARLHALEVLVPALLDFFLS